MRRRKLFLGMDGGGRGVEEVEDGEGLVSSSTVRLRRNELRHKYIITLQEAKSEIVQRSLKIKKALLYKADRSSFDCLCQQLYKKLLVDHKQLVFFSCISSRMDLCVPADLQTLDPTQDMRVSPSKEQKAEPDESAELPDISFEELLADENKDLFRSGRVY
ncbi:hypothetical protein C4D60_Mb10t03850 [Musa balbisiana]|uniref:Uncharacterized protein n=1 Tax=Musa balbisiana TaxID=52838 RepID=A0A4S8IVU3_MUSBA|nr:hypothetical protein C4D60_Mb10t03850 [Musa balbisiana]